MPKEITWNPGTANPKQKMFFQSRCLYTAYGGARGGGKSWAVRTKSIGGALANPGIKILILRKTYPEVEKNHIRPILAELPKGLATYNGQSRILTFRNGSEIAFGHWMGEQSEEEYRGLEFDWIFIDEATQFSERAFRVIASCMRGAGNIPKRMYLTCNPGGVGHRWVKRLFIERQYKREGDPESWENPEDYTFIPATVEDNTVLLEHSPAYLQQLASLPEDRKRAERYGDWDAIGGNYFPEFSSVHVRKPFILPEHWPKYRSFDYGLDMFACFWWAVDEDGRSWCYREFCGKNLTVPMAAEKMKELTHEPIAATYVPPDIWSRQKDTGRSMAEIFMQNGIGIVRADNNREQGHMMIKIGLGMKEVCDPFVQKLYPGEGVLPGLVFFDTCKEVIDDLRDIQADEKNPNDCAKDPHEITHTVDGVRYYAISRILPAQVEVKKTYEDIEDSDSYEDYMTGGEITEEYRGF